MHAQRHLIVHSARLEARLVPVCNPPRARVQPRAAVAAAAAATYDYHLPTTTPSITITTTTSADSNIEAVGARTEEP